jgi:hypothetical protein
MGKYGLTKLAGNIGYTRDGVTYGVSIKEDKNGFYAATHRARSKSYSSPDKIPVKDLKFIDSTG